jgi:hypothetical protein
MGLRSGIRDPGSRTRKKPTLDLGSRGQKGNGSRVPDPDPQSWFPGLLSGQAPLKARIYLHKTLVMGFYVFNFLVLVCR